MLLSLPPPSSHLYSSFSASQLFLASHFTFLLCRELCGVLTFPQWHLKCFLVQNILFIAIETGSSVWKKREKKKKVWESEALQFCYFAQIHKWQHAGRYVEACSRLEPEEQGLPVPKAQVLNPGLNQERAGLCRKDLCFSLARELPVESGEVGQTYILLSVLHLKS